jgi:hypothetical protein
MRFEHAPTHHTFRSAKRRIERQQLTDVTIVIRVAFVISDAVMGMHP